MSDSTQNRNARRNGKSRREVLRMAGAAGAAAAGFPLVGVARADSAELKIGYISCMSGPRTDFGVTRSDTQCRLPMKRKGGAGCE